MPQYNAQNILVTGGAGFIGFHFIRRLLNIMPSTKVINYDALTYAGSVDKLREFNTKPNYRFVHGNILDVEQVNKIIFDEHVDTIIHFAAESHVDRSIYNSSIFVDTNIKGTHTLLASAHQYWQKRFSLHPKKCRFYHISTDEVFGSLSLDDDAKTEKDKYAPNSPYSASKAAADHLVRAYNKTHKLPTVLSYCTNNYGPDQHAEKFIPTIIDACKNNQPIPIYGDGKNIRDWIYVEDHCRAIEKILSHGTVGESYNIAGRQGLANIELVHVICKLMDQYSPRATHYSTLICHIANRKGHDYRYALNDEKIRSKLGWLPQINLRKGLIQTIQYSVTKPEVYINECH